MASEHTKNMSEAEVKQLQAEVAAMDDEQLAIFRNSFDPDDMGFSGEEGATE